jgi:hypothetical protein
MRRRVKRREVEVKRGKRVSYNRVKLVKLSNIWAGRVSRLLSFKYLYQPEKRVL